LPRRQIKMKMKKKYSVGTAKVFISRSRAVRKLQLSLNDFRRLCILKGIYPREPLHIKKANKGGTQNRIYYHLRDIKFLANEPLINKFREYKIFLRKLAKAKAKREGLKVKSLLKHKPVFRLDTIVRERYPTFELALKDLDDALCICFAFSALTPSKVARPNVIEDCRRLTTEFMHYIIESNSLRKVFISIKGIYYQAEVMGESVTWVVGHERAIGRANEMDFSVMGNFADFYTTMLSFVNFRLYKTLGLFYPPQLVEHVEDAASDEDKVYSLACAIGRGQQEEDVLIDTFPEMDEDGGIAERIQSLQKLKTLFSGLNFFLNREVPKESLTLIIRSCGGGVSWDGCPAAKYDASSDSVTHQIVDRNMDNKLIMNRVYVQPQWIFDCFNACRLLPAEKYIPGAVLPPHLSPFVEEKPGEYVPPERITQLKDSGQDISHLLAERITEQQPSGKASKRQKAKFTPVGEESIVKAGKVFRENQQKLINEKGHDRKLREMMIPKKHRRVYKKIRFGEKRLAREAKKLEEKRKKLSKDVQAMEVD